MWGFFPKKGDHWKKNGAMYLLKKVKDGEPNVSECDVYIVEVEKVKDTGQECWS